MMKKNIFLILLFIAFYHIGKGQQLPQVALFMFNQIPLNPAYSGIKDYVVLGLNHRSQWTRFDGSPHTQFFTAEGKIKNKNYGVGGYFFNDKTGPLRNTGINASYAYHLKLNDQKMFLSMGISATAAQFSISGSDILLDNEVDDLVDLTATSSGLVPEFGSGILFHNTNYSVGFAAQQLLRSNKKVFKSSLEKSVMKNVGHYYITGSYVAHLDEEIAFIPSLLVNMIENNPTQVDLNIRIALSRFQFGLGYRTNDALVAVLNIGVTKFLDLNYAFDFQTSTLNQYNKGSHEVMLRYRLFYDELSKKAYLQQFEQ